MIHMRHPEIETIAEASEESFRLVHAPRGWELIPEPEATMLLTLGYVTGERPLKHGDDFTKAQLEQIAAQIGIEVAAKDSRDAIFKNVSLAIKPGSVADASTEEPVNPKAGAPARTTKEK